MRVALVVKVAGMDLLDRPADAASFRVPRYVIANFKFLSHVNILDRSNLIITGNITG